MRIGIGTRRGSFSITILLTCEIPFVFYDGMEIDNVIEVTNSDVDVTANDVEISTFRSTFQSTIRPSLTSTNVSVSFRF
jgi:hypothetical protein